MTSVKQAIDALEPVDGGWRGAVPDNWLQGRTAYGGFSAALALVAAQRSDDDLPPLRSAQVSFIGPLAGPVTIRAERLRRGRNAAFVQADVTSEAGLGLRATFVFMRAIESAHRYAAGTTPDFPAPTPDTPTFNGIKAVPFSTNFDLLDDRGGAGEPEWLRWVRLRDREGIDPAVELVAVADCLPPAAMKLVGARAPISSMTWLLNLLMPAPTTRDGWWMLRAATEQLSAGSSSQSMAIWNADGTPIAEQMQSVAIFA